MLKTSLDPEVLRLARRNRGPYLAALCAPRMVREKLLALIAFDMEIARIPRAVSDPMLGRIRLQWWIDALPEICNGNPPSHPVAVALSALGLPLSPLCALVEARNFDLQTHPTNLEQEMAYAEATGGALHVLMVDVMGVMGRAQDPRGVTAARDIGTAWVLSGLKIRGAADETTRDETIRALAFDLLVRARRYASNAQPTLALARLASRRLKNPDDSLGFGAALSVWGRLMTGLL